MIILRDLEKDTGKLPAKKLVLAIGNFDGLHLGHQAVIGRAVDIARQQEYASAVFTFRQHPYSILQPDRAPSILLPPEEKIRRIEMLGIEVLVYPDFTLEIASISPEEFIGHVLCEQLRVAQVLVGDNFRFGKDRKGTPETLREKSAHLGFQVTTLPAIKIKDQVVSSTYIRELLKAGDVRSASVFLNREYELFGEVVQGDGRGRKIGFPTANLKIRGGMLPLEGVYAAWAVFEKKRYGAMVNIGSRPTFPNAGKAVEVHLIDFQGDLYGETLSLYFVDRLRDEKAFRSGEALGEQILLDRQNALSILGESPPRSFQPVS